MRLAAILLAVFFEFATLTHAQAQGPNEFFNGVGRLIDNGMRAAVQAQWEQIPTAEVACIDRRLNQAGRSINAVIGQGIGPSDGRVAQIRSACRSAAQTPNQTPSQSQADGDGPSFDCNSASGDDEIAICGNSELSRLDRAIAAGFTYLRSRYGANGAQSVAGPLLRQRQACDGNVACIKRVQLITISAFQSRGAPIQADQAAPRSGPSYTVDGLVLGNRLTPDSPTYRDFACAPSEQFTDFTWCRRNRLENSPRGQFSSSSSIMLAPDGTIDYLNRYLEPAFFSGNEANDDINRLAIRLGPPSIIPMPDNSAAPNGLLAYWGAVSLIPLEPNLRAELAAGREIKAGLLLDHLGKLQRSAQLGLPVYRLGGGAGYVWAASWGNDGRGTLRFLAVDASKLPNVVTPPDSRQPAPVQAAPVTLPKPAETPAAPVAKPDVQAAAPVDAPAPAQPLPAVVPRNEAPPVSTPAPAAPVVQAPPAAPSVARPEPAPAPLAVVTEAAPPASPPKPAAPIRDVGSTVITAAPSLRPEPAAKPESNTLDYLLVIVIVALCGIVGWLLLRANRARPVAIGALPAPQDKSASEPESPVNTATDGAIIPPVAMAMPAAAATQSKSEPAMNLATLAPAGKPLDEPATAPEPLDPAAPAATAPADGPTAGARIATALQTIEKAVDHLQGPADWLSGLSSSTVAGGVLALATVFLAVTGAGIGALVPIAVAAYVLPSIIAFRRRHVYAWVVLGINVIFGFTGLVWLAMLIWAATGVTHSPLDSMDADNGVGLAPQGAGALVSDRELQSGWKLPVLQGELFAFDAAQGPLVLKSNDARVFLKNGIIGIFAPDGQGRMRAVRYDVRTQVRCVAPLSADTKLRAGKTMARSALTGLGAAIFSGRHAALGGAILDYRFGGDETEEIVTAIMVLSDFSSVAFQCRAEEYLKVRALLPPDVVADERAEQVGDQLARIRRMADDGPRVLDETDTFIGNADQRVAELTKQAESGASFAERDEARLALRQAQSDLDDARAVRKAVEALIAAGQPGQLRSA